MTDPLAWPRARLAEAVAELARLAGLSGVEHDRLPQTPARLDELEHVPEWLDVVASWLELEIDPVGLPFGAVAQTIWRAAPALVAVDDGYVAVVRRHRRGALSIVTPQGDVRRVQARELAAAIERRAIIDSGAPVEPLRRLLRAVPCAARQRDSIERALVGELLARLPPGERCWSLRSRTGASPWRRIRSAGGARYVALALGAHLLAHGSTLLAWVVLGRIVLAGRDDPGWLWAWALIVASSVPLSGLLAWAQGRLAVVVGAVLRERLLDGSLRLDPQRLRHEGVGRQLSRAMEAESLESMALGGGISTVLALVEFSVVVWVLAHGCAGVLHSLLAIAWLVLVAVLILRLHRAHAGWVHARQEQTTQIFERMVGHRTRLAQQDPGRAHEGEARALNQYLDAARRVDRRSIVVDGVLGRAWMCASMALILTSYLDPRVELVEVGIAVGGTLLGLQALERFSASVSQLVVATVAWTRCRPLLDAAARTSPSGTPALAASLYQAPCPGDDVPVLEVHDLHFRYRGRGALVLRECSARIAVGDRVLLEGRSGSGKSTLVGLLGGLHEPETGLVLLRGLDLGTVGEAAWRRRVVAVPQFHDNYVVSGTLAFNLLMGRRWPPTPTDLVAARELCERLGLGELLERMPSGLQQVVGETGWQLSHGERSRVFVARALLQRPDCVVFDESFGALDPENLANTMAHALELAPTAIVVAHP